MTNNDILRRLRYTFNLRDSSIVEIFALADIEVAQSKVTSWLKRDDDEGFLALHDVDLAGFLNGFINLKRGKREGEQPAPEKRLSNNMILQKLRIALNFKAEDVLAVLQQQGVNLSKHELSAFFRKPSHKHYRECQGQVLRNFLMGVQQTYRPKTSD